MSSPGQTLPDTRGTKDSSLCAFSQALPILCSVLLCPQFPLGTHHRSLVPHAGSRVSLKRCISAKAFCSLNSGDPPPTGSMLFRTAWANRQAGVCSLKVNAVRLLKVMSRCPCRVWGPSPNALPPTLGKRGDKLPCCSCAQLHGTTQGKAGAARATGVKPFGASAPRVWAASSNEPDASVIEEHTVPCRWAKAQ